MHPCAVRGRPHKWRGPQNLCASRCRRGALRLRRPNETKKQPPVTSKANNYSDDRAMMRTGRLVATNSTLHPPFCCCGPCVRKRRVDAYDALFAIPVSYSFGYVVVLFKPAACAYWGGRRGLEGRTATFTRFFHRQPWPYFVRGIIDHGSQSLLEKSDQTRDRRRHIARRSRDDYKLAINLSAPSSKCSSGSFLVYRYRPN